MDMVRCTRILEIIEDENLIENAARGGEKMIGGLQAIAEESRDVINNVRGKGLMIAFDLPDPAKRDLMIDTMFDNGLLGMKSGDRSIRFRGCWTHRKRQSKKLWRSWLRASLENKARNLNFKTAWDYPGLFFIDISI